MGVKWPLMVLICVFLMASGLEHLFMCFSVICMLSVKKCLFKSFVQFLNNFIYFGAALGLGSLLLHRLFSGCREQGLFSSCAQAFHGSGFSRCGAQALGYVGFCSCGLWAQ